MRTFGLSVLKGEAPLRLTATCIADGRLQSGAGDRQAEWHQAEI